jgi:hypothetical protein
MLVQRDGLVGVRTNMFLILLNSVISVNFLLFFLLTIPVSIILRNLSKKPRVRCKKCNVELNLLFTNPSNKNISSQRLVQSWIFFTDIGEIKKRTNFVTMRNFKETFDSCIVIKSAMLNRHFRIQLYESILSHYHFKIWKKGMCFMWQTDIKSVKKTSITITVKVVFIFRDIPFA